MPDEDQEHDHDFELIHELAEEVATQLSHTNWWLIWGLIIALVNTVHHW